MEIVTANSLGDGRVVFQTSAGWTTDIGLAELLELKGSADAALQRAVRDAARNIVVEPYLIDVARQGGGIVPTRLRERIRAEGPTTGNSHAKASTGRSQPTSGEGLGEERSTSHSPREVSSSGVGTSLFPRGGEGHSASLDDSGL